jgi:hypothetical protein
VPWRSASWASVSSMRSHGWYGFAARSQLPPHERQRHEIQGTLLRISTPWVTTGSRDILPTRAAQTYLRRARLPVPGCKACFVTWFPDVPAVADHRNGGAGGSLRQQGDSLRVPASARRLRDFPDARVRTNGWGFRRRPPLMRVALGFMLQLYARTRYPCALNRSTSDKNT